MTICIHQCIHTHTHLEVNSVTHVGVNGECLKYLKQFSWKFLIVFAWYLNMNAKFTFFFQMSSLDEGRKILQNVLRTTRDSFRMILLTFSSTRISTNCKEDQFLPLVSKQQHCIQFLASSLQHQHTYANLSCFIVLLLFRDSSALPSRSKCGVAGSWWTRGFGWWLRWWKHASILILFQGMATYGAF